MSAAWADFAAVKFPDVTFHALRRTRASQLIDAGVDIVTISKRLGHAKPDITLRVYAHMFKNDDRPSGGGDQSGFRSVANGYQLRTISLFVLLSVRAKALILLKRKGGRVV